ncbi:MAG: hypothetical protein ABJC09_08015 [Terriglobia bacterium]
MVPRSDLPKVSEVQTIIPKSIWPKSIWPKNIWGECPKPPALLGLEWPRGILADRSFATFISDDWWRARRYREF